MSASNAVAREMSSRDRLRSAAASAVALEGWWMVAFMIPRY